MDAPLSNVTTILVAVMVVCVCMLDWIGTARRHGARKATIRLILGFTVIGVTALLDHFAGTLGIIAMLLFLIAGIAYQRWPVEAPPEKGNKKEPAQKASPDVTEEMEDDEEE
jgi:hypothetical protein